MSSAIDVTPEVSDPHMPVGWIMFDPSGCPYAWCGSAFAGDAAAAMAFLVPDAAERQGMCDAGWSTSPRRVDEFVRGGRHLIEASA